MSDSNQQQAEALLDEISDYCRHLIDHKRLAAEVLLEGFLPEYVVQSLNEETVLRPIDLERLSAEWKDRIPDAPEVKAILAHLTSERFALLKQEMPRVWDILGIEEDSVQAAYQRRYNQPIESAFTPPDEYERRDSELSRLLMDADLNPLQLYMQRITLSDGDVLFRKGEPGDKVFVLTEGKVKVIIDEGNQGPTIRELEAYSLIGEMAFLTGAPRTATVQAIGDCDLQYIATDKLMDMIESYPEAFKQVFTIASNRYDFIYFLEHIPPFLGELHTDTVNDLYPGSKRIHLERGQFLVKEGDRCDGWYLVTNGRLAAPGTDRIYEEGDSLGEEEMLFNHPHTHSLVAVSDAEVIRISPQSFEALWNYPDLIRRLFKNTIHKLALPVEDRTTVTHQVMAVGTLGAKLPLAEIIPRMAKLFGQKRNVLYLDPQVVRNLLNVPESAFRNDEHLAWMRIRSWYTQTVPAYTYIVFAFDAEYPAWNKFCRSNADTLVAVTDAALQPAENQEWFEYKETPLPQDRWLVLVHPEETVIPTDTRRWLKHYGSPKHLHIVGSGDAELLRLMRMVTGTAIGVVFGGGTAKGFAHFGVMNAIQEVGIPVDLVGGTSIGSAVGAMYAMRLSPEQIQKINQTLLDLNPFRDFAVPRTALLKSRRFEQLARSSFGDVRIEDCWLHYFCCSTDLTTAEQIVHEDGDLWRATMASGALPMVIPPVIEESHVLVDGGLLNNVPADLMMQKTQGPVIAINVAPLEDFKAQEEAEPVRRPLLERVKSPIQLKGNPGIMDILVQSLVVSSHHKLRSTIDDIDLYLEPPVGHFGMTRFDAMDEMAQIGYDYAMPLLTEFKNKHPKMQFV